MSWNPLLKPVRDGEYRGVKMNTDFRAALAFLDAQSYFDLMAESLGEDETARMLAQEAASIFFNNALPDRVDLWEILMSFLAMENEGAKPDDAPLFDYYCDSARIYADFLTHYRIDLMKESLHWWTFNTLLESLPSDSAVKRAIETRQEEIDPKGDAKYKARMYKAKEAVMITNHWETEWQTATFGSQPKLT